MSSSLATSNSFAALNTKKIKKEKSAKDERKKAAPAVDAGKLEEALFAQPMGLSTNWADSEDEEEAFAAPSWAQEALTAPQTNGQEEQEEEEESDEEIDVEAEFGIELGNDHEHDDEDEEEEDAEPKQSHLEQALAELPKGEPEKQLSRKAQKAAEMEELDAALAEMGIDLGSEGGAAAGGGKKKKKKNKNKAAADANAQEAAAPAPAPEPEPVPETTPLDEKEIAAAKAKLAAAAKAKKGGKKPTGAAAKAAAEAKARAKKPGKKDRSNFNQAPTR